MQPLLCESSSIKGNVVKFGGASCWIRSREGKLVGMEFLVNKLYKLNCEPVVQQKHLKRVIQPICGIEGLGTWESSK